MRIDRIGNVLEQLSATSNEVTKSSWSNGVLTWVYYPATQYCLVQATVSLNSDALTVDWSPPGCAKHRHIRASASAIKVNEGVNRIALR